jgi:signal transduction histidine kinase
MSDPFPSGPIRCWEQLSCDRGDCDAHGSADLMCWLQAGTLCFEGSPHLSERLVLKCVSCPVFTANRHRAAGKRYSDQAVINTMDAVIQEMADVMSRMQMIEAESRGKSAQVTLLSEVGRALQSTMEIDDLLRIILTAVTAGDGLGFNRAFLLLVDEDGTTIRGRMAVGPADPRDAEAIWTAMQDEGKNLREILRSHALGTEAVQGGIVKMAQRFALRFDPSDNIAAKSLDQGLSFVVESLKQTPDAAKIARILGNEHFLVVPLVAEGKNLGVIIADNFVTRRRISTEDVRLLETFASQAALAIANASLHRDLHQRLVQLEEAHEELSRSHVQLLRAERLMALGGLAASFIHDLKAPLISIGLTARTAASGLHEDDAIRASLEKIISEIMEIEAYLKDLAQSATRVAKDTEPIDVSSVIRDAMELMRGWMAADNIEPVLRFNHGDAKVRGCAVEFKHMILNVLHNSLEAMPDGGKLTVDTVVEDRTMRIAVKDTGQGIPDHVKPRVFSVFFTTKPKGSGLGLFIVNRIVTDLGGTIEFDSKEGEGTCFSIQLPITTLDTDAGHAPAK